MNSGNGTVSAFRVNANGPLSALPGLEWNSHRRGMDEILGATIVAPRAGDLISEIFVATAARLGLGRLANVIHLYPTHAEALRQCGDAFNRTRLTSFVKNLMNCWIA